MTLASFLGLCAAPLFALVYIIIADSPKIWQKQTNMSNKCPRYGSCNTEVAISNYAVRGLVHVGRELLAAIAITACSIGGSTTGEASGYTVWKNTQPGKFYSHRCCNCGKGF